MTLEIRNDRIELSVTEDASAVRMRNLQTGTLWVLDGESVLADGSGADGVAFRLGGGKDRGAASFDAKGGSVERLSASALLLTRRGPAGEAVFRWELVKNGLRVTLLADRSTVTSCALPGAFRPEGVDAPAVALPKNQGVWHRGTGGEFAFNLRREGHGGFSMPFFAVCGATDALLSIIEDEHDARIWFEKASNGRMIAAAVADPSKGALGYDRRVLFKFVEPDVTSICRAYREYVKAGRGIVTWEEKIAARPNVERLFGALMCFIGYCQDESLDYAASLRRLKEMGVERAFVYPLAIGNVVEDFSMGGRPPIDIRRHLGLVEELGYLSAAWMWTEDVPEDSDAAALNAAGERFFGWQIDDVRWFRACPARQVELAERIQDGRMAGFTGHHFDVTASRGGIECFDERHPLDRRDDAAWRTKVMETATRRGCVVSSEGFWGFAAPNYDVGSVKIPVPVHQDWYTVPMTSLVYHDSLIHDWWEVDNYNNPHHRSQGGRGRAYFPLGGGWTRLQAAQDALAGWPPNVMPFGAQYAFVDGEMSKGTHLYRYTLDSPEVKEALVEALPVARLHARVGRLACVSHETLSPDGSVQATVFADGTRVVANFSGETREVPGAAPLEPQSWRSVP